MCFLESELRNKPNTKIARIKPLRNVGLRWKGKSDLRSRILTEVENEYRHMLTQPDQVIRC